MKKYELTNEIIIFEGRILHRIRALRSFGDVKAGDLGGFIEKEDNLSHDENCWVYDNGKVYQDARVDGNAKVREKAMIWDHALITDNAIARGEVRISDRAIVSGNAEIDDLAWIGGTAHVFMDGKVCECAEVFQDARIYDDGKVCGYAKIRGQAQIGGDATVTDFTLVSGNTVIYGDTKVCDEARICGNADICCDGMIKTENDLFLASDLGPHHSTATFFKTKTDGIGVGIRWFDGPLEDFEQKVKETYGGTVYEKQYEMAIEQAKYTLEGDRQA